MACPRIIIPILALVFLFYTFSEAVEILVGGKENSWNTIPSNSSERTYFDEWAKDLTIFSYSSSNPKKDSVLRVMKNFNSCNTSKPIERYRNKKTLIDLDRCVPFYFISGTKGHCEKGQELLANVACDICDVELLTGAPAVAPTPDGQGNGAIGSRKVGFAVVIGTLAGLLVT